LPVVAMLLLAQGPVGGGVTPEWDVRKQVELLETGINRLLPVLTAADPAKWSNQESAAAYLKQWQSCVSEARYLLLSTQEFHRTPEKLTAALDVLFRLDFLQAQSRSLVDGLRRHGNAAETAYQIESTLSQTAESRETLRRHIQDVAELREKEIEVARKEAQRCRVTLSQPGVAVPKPPPAKKQ